VSALSEEFRSVLAVDVGSTTTKAIVIERQGAEYHLVARAEAPTTVEAPLEDVMIGVRNAVKSIENRLGRPLMEAGLLVTPERREEREDRGTAPVAAAGVDLFVCTSSAGGGLQMTVAGLVKSMTAESAQRAALGAGAIVMDVISLDDARLVLERIRRLQELRPDMILLAGGTDDGNISHVAAIAEYIGASNPKPRLGGNYRVPLVYAGNQRAREYVRDVLGNQMDIFLVPNIRPTLEEEILEPARQEIHRLFLEHVMARAPGYQNLLKWAKNVIQPTPMAVGKMMKVMADAHKADIIGVDIGGATTDVFSSFGGRFHRTVSANLGMSYSTANVFVEASPANISRWLPFDLPERELRDLNANKMIRPMTLPATLKELLVEHAVAREAIRLSLEHHKQLAVGLKGVQNIGTFDKMGDVFRQKGRTGQSIIDPLAVNAVIGSGGVLSHAPRRAQAMLLLMDSIQPEGVTGLFVDSVFMMPHLGILAEISPEAALQLFETDCLVPLGTCVAPRSRPRPGQTVATIDLRWEDGTGRRETVIGGEIKLLPLATGEKVDLLITPARGVDVGAGPGRRLESRAVGGEVGLVLDGRGRPVVFPQERPACRAAVRRWLQALDAYPSLPEETAPANGGGR
jgi:uncharacterized protein (TIGR01319 family)